MRKLAAAGSIFLLGASFACADDFFAQITKIEGDKITVKKFAKGKAPEETIFTLDEKCKILSAKLNREKMDFDPGPALEGGLKHDAFKEIDRAPVMGKLTTDGDKCTRIMVMWKKLPPTVKPPSTTKDTPPPAGSSMTFGVIKKVDGTKILLGKFGPGDPNAGGDETYSAGENVKVMTFDVKKRETKDIPQGLKSDLITKGNVMAYLVLDKEKVVTEIRILTGVPKLPPVVTPPDKKGTNPNNPNNPNNAKEKYAMGVVKKLDGKKLVLGKSSPTGPPGAGDEVMTYTMAENVKVNGLNVKQNKISPLPNGLKNEMFSKGNSHAILVLDNDNNVIEIRMMVGLPMLPPTVKPPDFNK